MCFGGLFCNEIHAAGNLFVNTVNEIYSKTRRQLVNKVCDSCQTLSFVQVGIIEKIKTKAIHLSTGSTVIITIKVRIIFSRVDFYFRKKYSSTLK